MAFIFKIYSPLLILMQLYVHSITQKIFWWNLIICKAWWEVMSCKRLITLTCIFFWLFILSSLSAISCQVYYLKIVSRYFDETQYIFIGAWDNWSCITRSITLVYTVWCYVPFIILNAKIVSEYDQEIPQSQTADNPMASRGRATLPSRDSLQSFWINH